MGYIQRHGMGLRATGDRPRGDHRPLFTVDDHDLACVTHNYEHSWRRRIQNKARGIQAVNFNTSDKFAVF